MDKAQILQSIVDKLQDDLVVARQAAQTAHEAATHEESTAENKYDTFGLESAYLAEGQSRRVREIEQALTAYHSLALKPFDEHTPIQVSALIMLESDTGAQRTLFLGPDAGGLKLMAEGREVLVITPHSPMGQSLLGKLPGDTLTIAVSGSKHDYEIVETL